MSQSGDEVENQKTYLGCSVVGTALVTQCGLPGSIVLNREFSTNFCGELCPKCFDDDEPSQRLTGLIIICLAAAAKNIFYR